MIKKKTKNPFPKLLILLALSLAFSFILLPDPVHAQSNVEYRLETGIPGSSEFERGEDVTFSGDTLGKYIRAIYNYSLGIVGILAAVVLMIGGVIWLTAGGNVNRVETAKQWIGGALTGLVLMLTSYMLLYQINPELVAFPELGIDEVDLAGMPQFGGEPECTWILGLNCQFYDTDYVEASSHRCGPKENENFETCCCLADVTGEGGEETENGCLPDQTVCYETTHWEGPYCEEECCSDDFHQVSGVVHRCGEEP